MNITAEQLSKVYTSHGVNFLCNYVQPFNDTLNRYQINTPFRIQAFVAQVGHECAQLSVFEENLNYSASSLRAVFGKYFTSDTIAHAYAHQPQKIANRVYASRLGNGDENSGDGWKYHGRGGIQVTGKTNYLKIANEFNLKLEDTAAWLVTRAGSIMSAGSFWNQHNLNSLADEQKFDAITSVINGGQNGALDRHQLWSRAQLAIH